ncbi:hypothetical protein DSECCO2_446730 [anaerobic digester metagenome]
MTDFFKNGNGVGGFHWVLSQIEQAVEQLVDVGHVEVPGQYQVAGHPVVGPYYRVKVLYIVFPEGTVTQVTQEQFPGKSGAVFEPLQVAQPFRMVVHRIADLFVSPFKYVGNRGV